jgi:hypothetical protein
MIAGFYSVPSRQRFYRSSILPGKCKYQVGSGFLEINALHDWQFLQVTAQAVQS